MNDTCPKCGADRKPIDDLLFNCGSIDEYANGLGIKFDFRQSDACRIRELEAQLAAAVADNAALLKSLIQFTETAEHEARAAELDEHLGDAVYWDEQVAALKTLTKDHPGAALLAQIAELCEQLEYAKDPSNIDEARWLDERNAGAEIMANVILHDEGHGV